MAPAERTHPYGPLSADVKVSDSIALPEASIDRFLRAKAYDVDQVRPGVWRLSVDGIRVLLLAEDERVRILAPVFALRQLDGEPGVKHALMVRLLQSNFERAADARYAVFDGIVFAAVTHPRATLHAHDLDRFLMQVVNLHKNTFRSGRTAYSSSTPEPGSIEFDPRLDETLMSPEAFERGASPKPKPPAAADDRLVL